MLRALSSVPREARLIHIMYSGPMEKEHTPPKTNLYEISLKHDRPERSPSIENSFWVTAKFDRSVTSEIVAPVIRTAAVPTESRRADQDLLRRIQAERRNHIDRLVEMRRLRVQAQHWQCHQRQCAMMERTCERERFIMERNKGRQEGQNGPVS